MKILKYGSFRNEESIIYYNQTYMRKKGLVSGLLLHILYPNWERKKLYYYYVHGIVDGEIVRRTQLCSASYLLQLPNKTTHISNFYESWISNSNLVWMKRSVQIFRIYILHYKNIYINNFKILNTKFCIFEVLYSETSYLKFYRTKLHI